MSDLLAKSAIECWRKNSRLIRRVVASSLTCLAPFSQYSLRCRLPASGSGQAQPGQSMPSAWLMLSRLIAVRTNDVCSSEYSSAYMTAGTPAADFLGGLTLGFSTPMCSVAFRARVHRPNLVAALDHCGCGPQPSNRNLLPADSEMLSAPVRGP